jgi:hypothetical protein
MTSSFETPAARAPQDEEKSLVLMVRSAAKPRVSNHEGELRSCS